ncbi:hypothetical protein ERX46_09815 [Brumimicrobium glaciale]|uniref:Outer membrane protein beta-barrel domain-containing protein n=1 Tax=Brumimicrobium glaciale TaxID=200475 RepID=A0A4Q4KLI1_9FLAO|nr:hypothetical protein [Brumimicrobium glaciale]RYM34241.1 hypothetical protein ERX46_09815 [Brumimicrobium glaciale]
MILSVPVSAQRSDKKPLLEPSVRKMGPYIGLQRGLYTVGEIGMEFQYKDINFRKPKTHGLHAGLEYNIPNNALGFNAGYFHKPSRLDLTYGFDVALRSNFKAERYGISPVIGYKLFGLHIRAGYMFLTPSKIFTETNQLFVNVRFIMVNNRKFKWNKRK